MKILTRSVFERRNVRFTYDEISLHRQRLHLFEALSYDLARLSTFHLMSNPTFLFFKSQICFSVQSHFVWWGCFVGSFFVGLH